MNSEVSILNRIPTEMENSFYTSNRAPLIANPLIKLPIGNIIPKGWLRECLVRQQNGLSGKLGQVSAWLQKQDNAWLDTKGKGKWGWEEVPYWLRGFLNLSIILNDKERIAESKIWLDATLKSSKVNGDFGPDLRFDDKTRDLWSNMIMLNCLQSYYEYTNDSDILKLMTAFFKYEMALPDEEFLTHYWQKMRGGDNLYSVFWLYNRTGDEFLLELAEKIHKNTANWMMPNDLPNWHNVNIAQGFREPATYYQLTKNNDHLQFTYDNFNLIRKIYGQVPGGMWGGDENSRPGYTDPHQGIETCGIVEHMFSNEILLSITGDSFWADHIEELVFNTLPTAIMPDFKAIRYLTSPNMVLCDNKNHHPGIDNKGPFLLMNPFSSRCCQHNHSFGYPYYSEHLWMATPDNGVCATLYASSEAEVKVGDNKNVRLVEDTHYPFDDFISIDVHCEEDITFPLYLRIPNWCKNAILNINGVETEFSDKSGSYVKIKRKWSDGDKISIKFAMSIAVKRWEENKNALSVNYGPLTFSLKIDEKYVKKNSKRTALHDSKWQKGADPNEWPSWEIRANSSWNYGLNLSEEKIEDNFTIIKKEWPADDYPFEVGAAPILIKCKGNKIPSWKMDKHKLCGILMDSPVDVNTSVEELTLIPLGSARLRISAFPEIKK